MTESHIPKGEYGMTAAMERHAARLPAVGIDPAEIDPAQVTTPEAGLPVWADLVFPSGDERTVKAFAQRWTPTAVYVQYVHGSVAAYAWIRPENVRRRQLGTRADRSA